MADNVLELVARIQADLGQFGSQIAEAVRGLKALDDASAKLNRSLDLTGKEADGASDDVRELGREKLDGLAEGAESVAENVEDVGDESENSEGKTRKLAGISLGQLARQFGDLANRARQFAGEVGQALEGMGRRVSIVAGGMSAAIVGGLGMAAKSSADFQRDFAEVLTLLDQPTPELVENLRQGASDIAREFGIESTDAVKSLYQAISAGVPAAEAVEFLRQAAIGAKGGVADLTQSVDIGTNMLNAYGMESKNLGTVMDSVFVAVKLGKTTFGELSEAIGRVAPIAASAGVQVDELNGAIAALTIQGINTNEAVTGVRSALTNILKPTSDATKMAESLSQETRGVGHRVQRRGPEIEGPSTVSR